MDDQLVDKDALLLQRVTDLENEVNSLKAKMKK